MKNPRPCLKKNSPELRAAKTILKIDKESTWKRIYTSALSHTLGEFDKWSHREFIRRGLQKECTCFTKSKNTEVDGESELNKEEFIDGDQDDVDPEHARIKEMVRCSNAHENFKRVVKYQTANGGNVLAELGRMAHDFLKSGRTQSSDQRERNVCCEGLKGGGGKTA